MQLLTNVYSLEERQRIETLLNERGVATYARSTGTGRRLVEASKNWAIFVCINSQFDDAVALLSNPDHEVTDPVNVSEFNNAIEAADNSPIAYWLLKAVVIVALLFTATLYLLRKKYNA